MQLWAEYEGKTVAGAYILGKLLRSEGRNGFFATSDKAGNAAVIRITEAHYDEDEMLKRWRRVASMHQTNLIEIARVGHTSFEDIEIAYALMEPNDANLAEVLAERPLTASEATQVAKSLAAALEALHTSGLVHEHIEPANVLAVGDVVKLRSDCVRECITDIEFNTPEGCAELRRRDIRDFGVLLLQCLTLEKQMTRRTRLPEPFQRIVPGALEGTWTLEQIRLMLEPPGSASKPVPGAVITPAAESSSGATAQLSSPTTSEAPKQRRRLPLEPATARAASSRQNAARQGSLRLGRLAAKDPQGFSVKTVGAVFAAVAVMAVVVLWHFLGNSQPAKTAGPQTSMSIPPAPLSVHPAGSASATSATAMLPVKTAVNATGWYVIAYTYNHEGQAAAKAGKLNARYSAFHAQVFSPRGRAPYLVTLGGPMSEADAKLLEQRARRSGMPRDTYIRRY